MYDVIVVGGGIGGAAAAYFLGRADQQVLVLEKEALPRCKACGSAQIRFSPLPFSLSKHIPLALPGISSNAVRETRPAQGKVVGGSSE